MKLELRLDSAERNHIENEQLTEISAFELRQCANIEKDWKPIAVRSPPTPRYNCHGLAFASRRTGIHDAQAIRQILTEDSLQEISLDEVVAGDVAVYFDDQGDAEHSAVVLEVPILAQSLKIPVVVSKWGKGHELVHLANRCPYSFADVKYYRSSPQ